ncbi:hypothetical protein GT370_04065 [Acidocella sp. MX-AZ03]|uniref:hypothetical protein n=1 Tax=Acidocella sp. MX-AZ03 TaxID=2697363 RepID=UPI0022DD25A7|nr:hypothetical protein [Acidocella sp. MX-AZ03]WBO60042.1 hypothetical protein GT370_04065 [Acidocella sp. MX-AZ03]
MAPPEGTSWDKAGPAALALFFGLGLTPSLVFALLAALGICGRCWLSPPGRSARWWRCCSRCCWGGMWWR